MKSYTNSMNNSFYIFSAQKVTIERLHLCTWDVRRGKTRFELGIEILNEANNILQIQMQYRLLTQLTSFHFSQLNVAMK